MAIDVPTAGNPILDTWGADVAERLNQLVPIILTSAVATDDNTGTGGVELLSFDVVAGRQYNVQLFGTYEVSVNTKGPKLLIDETDSAAGTTEGYSQIATAGAASLTDYQVSDATWWGPTTTDTASVQRAMRIEFVYACTTSGTIVVTLARGGTAGGVGVTVHVGFGGLVIECPA